MLSARREELRDKPREDNMPDRPRGAAKLAVVLVYCAGVCSPGQGLAALAAPLRYPSNVSDELPLRG